MDAGQGVAARSDAGRLNMCRFALYLGAELTIGSLLTEPENSIIHQSFHSHEREEPLNGDGFGIAWYAPECEEPAIFKVITPAWNNVNLSNLARVTRTRCLLAHVRAASPGLAVQRLNCHPFAWRKLAFMHNGAVAGFRSIRRQLLGCLSDEAFDSVLGSTDSEHVFGLIIDQFGRARAEGSSELAALADSVRSAVAQIEEMRRESGTEEPSLLNLALSDGHRAVVSRFISSGGSGANSLYVHSGARYVCEKGVCRMISTDRAQGAVIIASEPLSGDPGWEEVPVNHLVTVDDRLTVEISPI